MKILGLKFKNINSLHGEWEIRFDRPPLSDTGLFAIVGPNGSGKSSILDALTLALYGETSRLKNPSLDIVNRAADESFSEVTFSVGENIYRSGWSVRREEEDREGEDSSPRMRLMSMNGDDTLLAERVIKVRECVAELTGLDFKRFCRSVLLSQGDFAAFLHSLESERAEILDRIVGPEIARELEEAALTQANIESEKLQQLKETAASFPVPGKHEVKDARQTHEQLQEDIRENERILETLRDVAEGMEKLGELEIARDETAGLLEQTEMDYRQAQADMERLERTRLQATPFVEEVKFLDDLAFKKERAEKKALDVEEEIQSGYGRADELGAGLKQLDEELLEARAVLDERGEEWGQAASLDRKIEKERQRFLELVAKYEGIEQSRKENIEEQKEIGDRIAVVEATLQELQNWIDDHAQDKNLGEEIDAILKLRERIAANSRELSRLREKRAIARETETLTSKELKKAQAAAQKVRYSTDHLLRRKAVRDRKVEEALKGESPELVAGRLQDLKRRYAGCRKLIKMSEQYKAQGFDEVLEDRLQEFKSERASLREALELEQNYLGELQGKIRTRELVRRLDPERAGLEKGVPCPLCGSLQHPYVDDGLPDFSELDLLVGDLKAKIARLKEDIGKNKGKAQKLEGRAQVALRLQSEWARVCAEIGVDRLISDSDGVHREAQGIQKEIRSLKSATRSAWWNRICGNFAGWLLEGKTEKLAVKDQVREAAMAHYETCAKELADISDEVQRLEAVQNVLRGEIENRLEQCGEALPSGRESGEEEESLTACLKARHDVYSEKSREIHAVHQELVNLEERRAALPRELDDLKRQAENLSAEIEVAQGLLSSMELEREGVSSISDPEARCLSVQEQIDRCLEIQTSMKEELDSLHKRIDELKNSRLRLKQEAQEYARECERGEMPIREKALSEGFTSLDDLRECVRLLEREEEVVGRCRQMQADLEEAGLRAEAAGQAFDAIRAHELAGESVENINMKIADKTRHGEELRRMFDEVETRLARYQEAEGEYREILQAIAVQEKIWSEVAGENKVLQSLDQSERRDRVRRLMLEKLIEQSNHYLTALSGRYSLGCLEGNGLSMVVRDFLQDNMLRPVKTLSGGESFLVSLCLALGLADMAGKHRRIESLFLDEGFGTLDEEMLYKVIAVLKSLKTNGKMVGIISHVKRLADEIPTQIKVEKMAGGLSRISIMA